MKIDREEDTFLSQVYGFMSYSQNKEISTDSMQKWSNVGRIIETSTVGNQPYQDLKTVQGHKSFVIGHYNRPIAQSSENIFHDAIPVYKEALRKMWF